MLAILKIMCLVLFSVVTLTDFAYAEEPREIARKMKHTLVTITTFNDSVEFSAGSGFVISGDGLVVTNYHVIEGGNSISVKTSNGETFGKVMVVDTDKRRDIAILRIPTRGLKALTFAPLDSVGVGDNVYAMGNPLGLEATFSSGIVSADRIIDGTQLIQVTAPISSGSSGGPVVNSDGQVIGVASAVMEEGQNLNFVVPIKYIQGLLDIAGQPILYQEFAQSNWPLAHTPSGEYEGISSWVIDSAQELGYNLSAIAEDLREFSIPMQEVAFQMLVQTEEAKQLGFEWINESQTGIPDDDGFFAMRSELEKGDYMAIAACDSDCSDIDLFVVSENKKIIASEEEDDSFPIATFKVHVPQTIIIASRTLECSAEPCSQGIVVMKRNN